MKCSDGKSTVATWVCEHLRDVRAITFSSVTYQWIHFFRGTMRL